MKVVFYASDKPREHMLAKALEEGLLAHGDEFEMRRTADYGEDDLGNDLKWSGPTPDTDVACVFGVKGRSRQIMQEHLDIGKSVLYFDKGYTREKGGDAGQTLYSRISVNAASPVEYMMRENYGNIRWERLGLKLPRLSNNQDGHVLGRFVSVSGRTSVSRLFTVPSLLGRVQSRYRTLSSRAHRTLSRTHSDMLTVWLHTVLPCPSTLSNWVSRLSASAHRSARQFARIAWMTYSILNGWMRRSAISGLATWLTASGPVMSLSRVRLGLT